MSAPRNFRAGGGEGRPTPKDEWRTPPELYARLDGEFGFALDAACSIDNCLAPLGIRFDEGADALRCSWSQRSGGGAVWCNPPYSTIRPWLEKARQAGRVVTVVVLVPADTSTRWWRDLVAQDAAEVRFVVGRIRFLTPDGEGHYTKRGGGGLTTPSALVIYRPQGGPPAYSYIDARPPRQRRMALAGLTTRPPTAPSAGEREGHANG